MTHAQATERVRQLVADAFTSLGVAHPDQFRESILMHGGHYCGRRFEATGAHAVWFVEENQIKVVTSDGRAQVLPADEQQPLPTRRAA
jgi:plasmid stabilization system protein ParE